MSALDKVKALEAELQAARLAAADEIRAEKAGVIAEILSHMAENKVSLRELSDAAAVAASKYSSGTNTWSGKGKQPEWLSKGIAAGATLESFLTVKPKPATE